MDRPPTPPAVALPDPPPSTGEPNKVTVTIRQAIDHAVRHREAGRLAAAERICRQVLAVVPSWIPALNELGSVLRERGRPADAIPVLERAIAIDPLNATLQVYLGGVLRILHRLEEAAACYRRAIELAPDLVQAHTGLGSTLSALGRIREAVRCYRQALAVDPTHVPALNQLAMTLTLTVHRKECAALFERVLAARPNSADAIANLLHARQFLCDWREYDALNLRLERAIASGNQPATPFALLGLPLDEAALLKNARRYATRQIIQPERALVRRREGNALGRDGRLTIGYFSSDFRNHPMCVLLPEIFELHDRARFRVLAFSFGDDDGSPMRARAVRAVDRFIDLEGASHTAAAQAILDEDVDILIDRNGYTRHARTPVLSLRPAPIQVNYIGFPGTMGADFIDYIIVDPVVVPPDRQPSYTERLVHLPECYQPNDRQRRVAPETPSRTDCGLPERGFVFCCFNSLFKITPDIFALWMRLLRAVPGGVLWLLAGHPAAATNLRQGALAHEVDPSRLVFAPRLALDRHLARHRVADLFLDTMPYNAHTTASDALWAGLPVITMLGRTFGSRVAASLLMAVALPGLVTHSLAEYEALALRLAQNPAELAALRVHLAEERLRVPLFDSRRYTGHLERAYETMADIYRAGQPARAFAVPAL